MYEPITSQINYSISPWINHPCNQPHRSQSIIVDWAESNYSLLTPFLLPSQQINEIGEIDAASDVAAYRFAWGQFSSLLPCTESILLWPLLHTLVAFSVCQVCACNQLTVRIYIIISFKEIPFVRDAVPAHLALDPRVAGRLQIMGFLH